MTFVASWNGPSNQELDFIDGTDSTGSNASHVSWSAELPDVVFIEVVTSGTPGLGAIVDLQTWMATHGNVLTVSTDPLAVYFDGAAVPLNIDIDPRTMRILDASLGFDTNLDQTLKALLATL